MPADDLIPDDPFDTAGLRERVLAAWAASAARFREDANAEEDYALGGYRDRVIVELAQNAADAAARAGVPGRLRLTLRPDGTLVAANTGAPLDATGVEGLSTLRASGKRDEAGAAGRFGVGFAAVVAVSDSPVIASASGAVRWSRAQARALAAAIPALAGELVARDGNVPVLRLPFPADAVPPDGLDTVVLLPPRDDATVALLRRLLTETGPALLLALPALAEVTIEADGLTRTLTATHDGAITTITEAQAHNGGGDPPGDQEPAEGAGGSPGEQEPADGAPAISRWLTAASGGPVEPALLADRPVEERARPAWSVRWAVPLASPRPLIEASAPGSSALGSSALGVSAPGASAPGPAPMPEPGRLPDQVSAVVHAPTPSDEPLGLPALLLASFPLSPDRRHVAPGPLTDFLVERAADAYASLLPGLAPGHGLLNLVPGPVAAGQLDVQLRQAIVDRLPLLPFLPPAGDSTKSPATGTTGRAGTEGPATESSTATGSSPGTGRVSPRDALLLDLLAPPGLAGYLADLLPGLIGGPSRHPAYATLGLKRLPLAEIVDLVATLERPPSWWRGLYAALAGVDPGALPELGALPVPLADGRLIRGPRGVLIPMAGLDQLWGPAGLGTLAPLRLRVVHPEAVHPLLSRLGALEATPRGVLDHPATIAAVDASLDEEDPGPIADAVLSLVRAAGVGPGEFPWLADLALPTADEDWDPAGDLLLPGGELASVVAADAGFGVVDPELAERYGPRVLEAVGVLGSFGLLTASDVDFSDGQPAGAGPGDESSSAADLDLDGAEDWADSVRARCGWSGDEPVPPVAVDVTAVRDLELVDPVAWTRALEILTRVPRLRAALLRPTRVRDGDGAITEVPSYTAWWLHNHPVLSGRRPADLRAASADPLLEGLYDDVSTLTAAGPGPANAGPANAGPAEADLADAGPADAGPADADLTNASLARLVADKEVSRALGIRDSLADLLAEPGGADELLDRLADPARPVSRAQLRSLWVALATGDSADGPGLALTAPDRVRAVLDGEVVVADADDVLVLDSPDLYPLAVGRPLILAPYDLAFVLSDLLDIPVASEVIAGKVETSGERRPVPALVLQVFPDAPETYLAHDSLLADGTPVPWRCADGDVHISCPQATPVTPPSASPQATPTPQATPVTPASASAQALASGLAWASGQWQSRHLLATLLASPNEAARLQAEADLEPTG